MNKDPVEDEFEKMVIEAVLTLTPYVQGREGSKLQALLIEEVNRLRAGKTKHDGDCTIYSALCNGCPTDGICTCGFGQQRVREGDFEHMYSKERRATFPVVSAAEVKSRREFIEEHFN